MRNNKLEQYVKEQANKRFEEIMKNAQECVNIADLGNWNEISPNFFIYKTTFDGVYEIMIKEMRYDQCLSNVQADLFLAAEVVDRVTGQETFKRELIASGTATKMIKAAQANLFSLYDWEAA